MVHSLTNDTYQAGAQSKDESNWEASQPGTIDNYVLKNENTQFASSDHMLAQDMDVCTGGDNERILLDHKESAY